MIAYLPIALFALTAIVVAIVLADCAIRFRNAWTIARRNLSAAQSDLYLELQPIGSNVVALRRPARHRPPQAIALSSARRLPTIADAASAAA